MIILDTSVWIEFFRGKDPSFQVVRELLTQAEVIGIPWIFGELLQGCRSQNEIGTIIQCWKQLKKPGLHILEDSWIKAGEMSSNKKLHSKGVGIIDCAIASSAQLLDVKVWTFDKKLAELLNSKGLIWNPLKRIK